MKKYLTPKVVLLVILGLIIGVGFFILGEVEDAPGLCAIGLSVGFVLIMLGLKQAGVIKKGLLAPILLLFFGGFIALLTTAILIDGEFGDKPWYSTFGYAAAAAFLIIGLFKISKVFGSKK